MNCSRRPLGLPAPLPEGTDRNVADQLLVNGATLKTTETIARHTAWTIRAAWGDTAAACLDVLRRDGFISLDAGAEVGTLVTAPFLLPKGKL